MNSKGNTVNCTTDLVTASGPISTNSKCLVSSPMNHSFRCNNKVFCENHFVASFLLKHTNVQVTMTTTTLFDVYCHGTTPSIGRFI